MANGDAPNCYYHDRHDHGINDNGPVEKSAGPFYLISTIGR